MRVLFISGKKERITRYLLYISRISVVKVSAENGGSHVNCCFRSVKITTGQQEEAILCRSECVEENSMSSILKLLTGFCIRQCFYPKVNWCNYCINLHVLTDYKVSYNLH
jgi:hypothetical protein